MDHLFAPFFKTLVLLSPRARGGAGAGLGNPIPAFAGGLTPLCPWTSFPLVIKHHLLYFRAVQARSEEKLPGKEFHVIVQ